MAGAPETLPSFGQELKDGFKSVNAWIAGGISFLADIEGFYRERSVLEKEYAAKLKALSLKYQDKKSKRSASLSVGDEPLVTPGSLEAASLTTFSNVLSSAEVISDQHGQFGDNLISQVAEPLRIIGSRNDDLRKRHEEISQKMLKEREIHYAQLKKQKETYDATCGLVEKGRKNVEKGYDKSKAERNYAQLAQNMHNEKNTYLIQIAIANREKEKYFHEDIPDLLDSLQDLNETRVAKMNALWTTASMLESDVASQVGKLHTTLISEIARNLPHLDSIMFMRHNAGGWNEPPDFSFEPCPIWHDTDDMVVDAPAVVFLKNKLSKTKAGQEPLRRDTDKLKREWEGGKKLREGARGAKGKEETDHIRSCINLLEQYSLSAYSRYAVDVEVATISGAIGNQQFSGANQPHNFKSHSFKIPETCDLCGDRIWGLNAKGSECRDCGYHCHSKCEMKVPAECPGQLDKAAKKERKKANAAALQSSLGMNGDGTSSPDLTRSNTVASTRPPNSASDPFDSGADRRASVMSKTSASPSTTAPAASKPRGRILAPPPEKYVSPAELPAELPASTTRSTNEPKGKMLFAYQANGGGEISIDEGTKVALLEPDDGSGWIKVRNTRTGDEGLVPATYAEISATAAPALERSGSTSTASIAGSSVTGGGGPKKKGPAVAPRRGAKKIKHIEALYDYEARTEDEFSMTVGEKLVLVTPDQGDGWIEVERGGITKSVPANYVQEV